MSKTLIFLMGDIVMYIDILKLKFDLYSNNKQPSLA